MAHVGHGALWLWRAGGQGVQCGEGGLLKAERRGCAPAQDLAPEIWAAAVSQLGLIWGISSLSLPEALWGAGMACTCCRFSLPSTLSAQMVEQVQGWLLSCNFCQILFA